MTNALRDIKDALGQDSDAFVIGSFTCAQSHYAHSMMLTSALGLVTDKTMAHQHNSYVFDVFSLRVLSPSCVPRLGRRTVVRAERSRTVVNIPPTLYAKLGMFKTRHFIANKAQKTYKVLSRQPVVLMLWVSVLPRC